MLNIEPTSHFLNLNVEFWVLNQLHAFLLGHPRVSSQVPKFRSSQVPGTSISGVAKFPELQVPKFQELQVTGISNNIIC